MKTNSSKIEKRVYHLPRLITYGAIREITQSSGIYMMLDGGTANMMKRSATAP